MHLSSIRTLLLAGVVGAAAPAWGQALVREAIPGKWIEEYLPEKLPELKHPGHFSQLEKAQAEAFAGRFKKSLITLQGVKGDEGEIALVKGISLSSIGKREEAIAALSEAPVRDQAKVQVLRARILSDLGRHAEAIALLEGHVAKNPQSIAGRYHLADICEKTGDLVGAREQYEWLYKTHYDQWVAQGSKLYENAEEVTLLGRAFDRWATMELVYQQNQELHEQILQIFVDAQDVIDRRYWPAKIAQAEYLSMRGGQKEAQKAAGEAIGANPSHVPAYLLLGKLALESWNFDATDKCLEAVRNIDPTSVEADLLETRALLQQRVPKNAQAVIQRVLDRQPEHIEALGLLAACYALQMKEELVQETMAKVEKLDPDNATAYLDLAEQLGAMRQYPRAEATYRKAIERAPYLSAARNGLGLLLTQSGDEEEAKIELAAAKALDPHNFRTDNYLNLLRKMEKMQRLETDHFILLYDQEQDPLTAEYFLDYLESIHPELVKTFGHAPAVKTIIEVFPTHERFSARVTGAPWIGTVGASTGRVIALVTPRLGPRNKLGNYNWAQVLRHEYTHTVTLSATENRIGHWMTEGLAVVEEHVPMRFEWVPMLYNAVTKKELFSMDDLTWAFVRPKRPQDRSLAYAQSFWICSYIEEKWGRDALLRMMAEFKSGKSQDDVFPIVLGVNLESFHQEFLKWTEKQVEGWGYDAKTTKKKDALQKKAEQLTQAKKYPEAIEAWEAIVKLRPVDQVPHMRLAGLYLAKGETQNYDKALEHLIRLHQVSLKDNRFAKRIARVYQTKGDFKLAGQYALEAVYVDPYDLDAHELLLEIHHKNADAAGIERETRAIAALKSWREAEKARERM